jgi:hypothetical protein
MGIATFPAASGGLTSAIKSIQRGTAASAGNITISAVTVSKTICNSFSTGSAGTVAATGSINASNGTASAQSTANFGLGNGGSSHPGNGFQVVTGYRIQNRYQEVPNYGYGIPTTVPGFNINAQNVALNATNLTGGSTSLTSAVYGIHLVNETTITATGPCRYEVIEYF